MSSKDNVSIDKKLVDKCMQKSTVGQICDSNDAIT